jgi:hypothetical protein
MGRKRKPQIVWVPEQDGYLWANHARERRSDAVDSWCELTGESWSWWRKQRPTLRVVKVELRPVSP